MSRICLKKIKFELLKKSYESFLDIKTCHRSLKGENLFYKSKH